MKQTAFSVKHFSPVELLRYAGLFTWLCAAIPLVSMPFFHPAGFHDEQYIGWWILHLAFGFTYWNQVRELPVRSPLWHRWLSVLVLSLSALGVSVMAQSGLGGILLLIIAGLLPWMLPLLPAMIWLLAQTLLLALTVNSIPGITLGDAAMTGGLFLGISLFAFMSSVVALRQHAARDELRQVNSELRATQALLAENTRIAERVRIARELHDLVGHHLTALTLNLEVAAHLVDGQALGHVQQARSLAKLLLADVREVVSDMRDADKVDLAAALQTLVDGVPEPRIHLNSAAGLSRVDPASAQVLLRCAQEMISNCVRHADARNLWLRLQLQAGGVTLSASDDGCGTDAVEPGNGLKGMAERLRQLGGELVLESRAGAGFSLYAHVPMEGAK